jgi:SAM-dependent methyltransferase
MSWRDNPWERIFAAQGHRYPEPFFGFPEVVRIFRENGCREVLDLGCGTGRHAVHLAKAGFATVGVDISGTGLRLTRRWAADMGVSVALAQTDTRWGVPLAAESFDGVLSTNVIYYARLAEARRAIQDIHRVLRVGGVAFVIVCERPTPSGPFMEIEPSTYVPQTGIKAGLPQHIFCERTLRHELRSFDVVDVTHRADGVVLAVWLRKR